jgi:hypothetical protein
MKPQQIQEALKHLATKEELKHLATKEDLALLRGDLFKALLEFQSNAFRTLETFKDITYKMILGTYGLIIVGIFVNHFWR